MWDEEEMKEVLPEFNPPSLSAPQPNVVMLLCNNKSYPARRRMPRHARKLGRYHSIYIVLERVPRECRIT